jgi:hypothetical protein
MIRYQTFKVEWQYSFPLDMLRYDCCWPVDQQAVIAITTSLERESRGPHRARLARKVERKTDIPTIQRWLSFGVTVSDIVTR